MKNPKNKNKNKNIEMVCLNRSYRELIINWQVKIFTNDVINKLKPWHFSVVGTHMYEMRHASSLFFSHWEDSWRRKRLIIREAMSHVLKRCSGASGSRSRAQPPLSHRYVTRVSYPHLQHLSVFVFMFFAKNLRFFFEQLHCESEMTVKKSCWSGW